MFGGFNLEAFMELMEESLAGPNLSLRNVDTFGKGITNLDLSTFDKGGNISNYAAMFANATALQTVNLGGARGFADKVSVAEMFYNCSSLTTITGLNNFGPYVSEGLFRMFSGCSSLEILDLSSFDTTGFSSIYSQANSGMFEGCSSLKQIDIGTG